MSYDEIRLGFLGYHDRRRRLELLLTEVKMLREGDHSHGHEKHIQTT